uniref:Uncharacterized protein n=1 Tax=Glossina palpalis gambiensis TaxID=67801 RepID=A0A1B0BXZ5_9MUSC
MASSKTYQKPMLEQMDKAFFLKLRTSRAPSQRFSPISKNIRISQSRKHLPIESEVAKAELLCDLNRKVLNQLVDERKKAQLLLKDALQNIKLLQRELDQPLTQRKQLSQDLQSMNLLLKDIMNK